jgi:hypothetical protein
MYRIFDLALDSQISLPELAEIRGSEEFIRITVESDAGFPEPSGGVWQHEFLDPEGHVTIRSARTEGQYLLKFPDICDFIVSPEGSSIICIPQADVPDESVRHLLLDQVVPRMLGQDGRLVLHASAIALADGSAVAFVGESGWGKSTIASAFYDDGFRLLTDDCLLLKAAPDGVVCIPNYYGLRLYQDSADAVLGIEMATGAAVAHYTDKRRHLYRTGSSQQQAGWTRLAAIFLLNHPEQSTDSGMVRIEPIKGAEEMTAIIRQMFVLDPTDSALTIKQFKLAASLVTSNLPIFRLSYAREYSVLPEVRQSVINSLGIA